MFSLQASINDDAPVFGAAVRACEKRIFPVECDWTNRALDGVGVEFNAAIIDEAHPAPDIPTYDCSGETLIAIGDRYESLRIALERLMKAVGLPAQAFASVSRRVP